MLASIACLSGLTTLVCGNTFALPGLALLGDIVSGIGCGLLYALWGVKLSRLPDSGIILYVALGFALSAVVMLVVNLVGGIVVTVLFVCLVFSLFMLNDAWTPDRNAGPVASPELPRAVEYGDGATGVGNLPFRAFVKLSIMMLIVVFTYTVSVATFIETTLLNRDLEGVIVAILAILIILVTRHIRLMTIFRFVLPVVVAAYLFMQVLPFSAENACILIAGSGIKISELFAWIALLSIAHERGGRRWFVAGVATTATFAGRALAGLFVMWMPGFGWYSPVLAMYLLVILMIVAVILMLPEVQHTNPTEKKAPQELAEATPPVAAEAGQAGGGMQTAPFPSAAEICSSLAAEFALTPRESEVLQLLAAGRSQGFIASRLGITEGTAHVHATHVYQKLDVHNQQALISLVEDYVPPALRTASPGAQQTRTLEL